MVRLTSDAAATHDPYAALRYPNFRRYVAAHWAMTLATQIQAVVVGWQVYEITGDPLALGLIGLAEALPFIAFALYAGHVADRAPRRTIAVRATAAMTLCAGALLLFTTDPRFLAAGRVWPIYAVIFVSGIARSFVRPASVAFGAELVPRETYPNAVTWRMSTWQLAAVLGPAVGGLLYGFASARAGYIAEVSLLAVSTIGLMLITHRARPLPKEEVPVSDSLKVGLRFVRRDPVLLGAMTLDLFSVLFGGATALLPIFANLLGAGPQGLGVLRAAPAVGSIISGLVLAHRPPMRRAGMTLLAAVGAFGACMIAFALSRNFALSFVLLAASGMADAVSVIVRATLLQTRTPSEMLGRVSSVNQMFIGSSNEIGAFESGVAARLLGVVPSVVFGGSMTLLVVILTAWLAPQLRRLKSL